MTINYGLRNPVTGRIIRLSENRAFHGDSSCHLSESPELPYWKVEKVSDLIATWCEDRPDERSHRSTPAWRVVNPHECQPIAFLSKLEYDVAGGDPVCRTERLVTFEIGSVRDLRQPVNRTVGIETRHYGIMQELFTRYDMDRIDTMSLAIVWHQGGPLNLRGSIGMTHDKGSARIVGIADLPEDWPLTEEQVAYKPFADDAKRSLLLLDTAELETWIDFDQIDPDNRLSRSA